MKHKRTNSTCFFTIVSKNYLPYARTLMESIRQHSPGSDLIVVICDKVNPSELENKVFDILPIDQLNIQDFDEFVFQYTILELNTAVKPFAFEHLFRKFEYSKVTYFDPDIRIYGSLQGLLNYLENYQIVITPHLTGPLNDGKRPYESDILKAGTYNLGFIALSEGQDSRHLLTWWSGHLRKECIVDIANGIFVDQKWIDLVPGMYDSVKIIREPGWNVAYWNLLHRKITKEKAVFLVNNSPLIFFHFSGIKAKEKIFSIHQNRYQYDSLPTAIRELVDDYIEHLENNDSDQISSSAYTYGSFDDGTPVPDVMRYAFRRNVEEHMGAFSLAHIQPWVIEILNKPENIGGVYFPFITRLSKEIYSLRHDLQVAFPDLSGVDGIAYGEWFSGSAHKEYGLPDVLIKPVREAVFDTLSGYPTEQQINPQKSTHHLGKKIFIKYKQYPFLYKIFSRITSVALRGRMRNRLLQRGNKAGSTAPRTVVKINQISAPDPGINVIGYLHAESGTGEAVRSTLRALNSADINVSAIDVRFSNISRMKETPPVLPSQEQRYGVNLFHINADQSPIVLKELGGEFYENHYNIGFWFWELGSFPDFFSKSFNHLDEIWVASTFCQEAISLKSHVPVVNIPLCIDLDLPKVIDRSALGLPQEGVIFLSIMDVMSIPERKNPLGVLEAFSKAFPLNSKDVYLVLKLSNMDRCPVEIREKIRAYLNHSNIILLEKYMNREELNGLLYSADCYFAMHRSEGFGLPIAESMYLGKPVIATGWSSNMDFMNLNNSLPLKYELIELDRDHGPYTKGSIWAEPDIDHAVECLQKISGDRALREQLGKNAARDMRTHYSPSAVGKKIKKRLELIELHEYTP